MATLVEICLPEGIMEERREIHPDRLVEAKDLLSKKLPAVISVYSDLLQTDTSYLKRVDLARVSEAELQEHLRQLSELSQILAEFSENPTAFQTRVQNISQDDNSHTARLRRLADPEIGIGLDQAQTQLAFFAQLGESGMSREDAISARSLEGLTPGTALRRAEREVSGGRIVINTIKMMRASAVSSRMTMVPQAGIEIVKVGDYIDFNGLKPLGAGHFHHMEFPNEGEIEMVDYQALRTLVMRLAGDRNA